MSMKAKRILFSVLGVVCFIAGGGTWDKTPTAAGIATIITAFSTGSLIAFFRERWQSLC